MAADPIESKELDSISDVDSIIESISEVEFIDENLEVAAVKSTVSDDGYCSPCDQEFIVGSAGISINADDESTTQSAFCSESWEIQQKGSEERSFEVLDIPGKGKGMFATKKIYPGEVILSEIPLVITTDEIFNDYEKCEKFLDKEVDKMSMQQRKRFLSLSDGRNEDPTYLGRFYTNDMCWDGDVCLCPTMARVNHSCRPNSDFYTRADIGEQRLVASCIIEQGGEITICYLPSADEATDIREARQYQLRMFWGFQCTCIECILLDKEFELNEILREEIKELQSGGLQNLMMDELQRLLLLCLEICVKPTYQLEILNAMYDISPAQVDKYIQSVNGLVVAINSNGEDSSEAKMWRERLQLDEFSQLQF